ncbi:MAG: XRE family transcriptional regulator, partial [Sphingomonadaceae bacterium]
EEEFRARVVELTRLDQRTRREIWIDDGGSKSALQQLRALFRDVNNGRLPDVPMPRSIDLMVPDFGGDLGGLSVSVVDTKGMDEITVRADLDARLKDPRTHVVLCSTFNQAPSTSVQLLLDQLQEAHGINVDTGKVSILALPRPGEAMAVKDDTGEPPDDDEEGYQLKRDQILRQLGSGDTAFAKVPVYFFNAHDDRPDPVRAALFGQIRSLREHEERRLQDECAAVEEVLHNHQQHAFNAAVQEVAKRLGHFLDAHRKIGARVRPVHKEIVDALSGTRYASTVWAMTRRNGEYYNFSVTHHLGSGCARDALLRTQQWFDRLQGEIETLKQDPDLKLAGKTIAQIEASATAWRRNFAESVRIAAIEVYREEVEEDGDLWVHCAGEWGQGQGFRDRVVRRLSQWFESRTDLNDALERVIANIWANEVVSQMERLTKESWEQQAENEGVVPLLRKAS